MGKHFYPAIFTEEKDGGYSILFPDLDGCFTEADTITQAYENAQSAIGLYLDNNGKFEYPATQAIKQIKVNENESIVLVEFDEEAYLKTRNNKAVKKTVTIPEWLNIRAEQNNINFSQTLQEALKQRLNLN